MHYALTPMRARFFYCAYWSDCYCSIQSSSILLYYCIFFPIAQPCPPNNALLSTSHTRQVPPDHRCMAQKQHPQLSHVGCEDGVACRCLSFPLTAHLSLVNIILRVASEVDRDLSKKQLEAGCEEARFVVNSQQLLEQPSSYVRSTSYVSLTRVTKSYLSALYVVLRPVRSPTKQEEATSIQIPCCGRFRS